MKLGVMHYFPRNLIVIYPKFKSIEIIECGLKEIQQSDIKMIPHLVHLALPSNEIEILENGLFDYNLELKYINLYNNKIFRIGTKVFDNVNSESYIILEKNTCNESKFDILSIFYDKNYSLNEAKKIAKKCVFPYYRIFSRQNIY